MQTDRERQARVELRRARVAAGYATHEAFAEALGVHRATYTKIEDGYYMPPLPRCRQIARLVGRTVDELWPEDGEVSVAS